MDTGLDWVSFSVNSPPPGGGMGYFLWDFIVGTIIFGHPPAHPGISGMGNMLHDRLLKEQLNFLLLVTRCYVSGHMLHSQYLPFLWDKETEKSKENGS